MTNAELAIRQSRDVVLPRVSVRPLRRVAGTMRILARLAVAFAMAGRHRTRDEAAEVRAELLTSAFERLGGTYLKFGQILAMRQDYVPPQYTAALSRLLDEVPPFDSVLAHATIEAELGAGAGELFAELSAEPIAAASFGQVYRARLHDGTAVAVKVQRPGITELVAVDLALMRMIATVVDLTTLALPSRLRDVVAEFSAWTLDELDYRREARYAEQIRHEAAGDPLVVIPRVHWDKTTQRVLTLDFITGVSLKSLLQASADPASPAYARFVERGLSFEAVAKNLLEVVLRQAFVHGRFHADPHAANVIVLPGNRIGLVDFGICGYLGNDLKKRLLTLMREMGRQDSEAAFWASVRVLDPPEDVDLRSFRRDYRNNLDKWLSTSSDLHASLKERSALSLMMSSLEIVRRYRIGVQTMVLRYYRAMMLVDIVALQLAPHLNLRDEMVVTLTKIMYGGPRRRRRSRQAGAAVLEFQNLLATLPARIGEMMMIRREERLDAARGRPRWDRLFADLFHVIAVAAAVTAVTAVAWGALGAAGIVQSFPGSWPRIGSLAAGAALASGWLARRLGRF